MRTGFAVQLDEPWIELHRGNWAEAAEACHRLLSEGTVHWDTLRALAIALRNQGRSGEACDVLQTAATLDVANPLIWSDLGFLRYEKRDWRGALAAFTTSLDLEPTNVTALLGKSESLISLGHNHEAIPVLRECIRLAPERKRPRFCLAQCLVESGQIEQALAVGEECLTQERSENSLLLISSIEHRRQRLEDSLKYAEAAYKLTPASFSACASAALARWNCGDTQGAMKAREDALRFSPASMRCCEPGLGDTARPESNFRQPARDSPKCR